MTTRMVLAIAEVAHLDGTERGAFFASSDERRAVRSAVKEGLLTVTSEEYDGEMHRRHIYARITDAGLVELERLRDEAGLRIACHT